MELIDQIQAKNKLDKELIEDTMGQMFTVLFNVPNNISSTRLSFKYDLVQDYIGIVQKMLSSGFVRSNEKKIQLIDFIDRLNTQSEVIEFLQSDKSKADLKKAAKRLGDKAQSSFS